MFQREVPRLRSPPLKTAVLWPQLRRRNAWLLVVTVTVAVMVGLSGTGRNLSPPVATSRASEKAPQWVEGQTWESALAAGEDHVYAVQLGADTALRVELLQRQVDVTLTLRSPAGEELHVDSPNGPDGYETLVAIAAAPGNFQLVVGANAGAGSYRLAVTRRAPASAADRAWTQAQALFTTATACSPGDRAACTQAQAQLQEALVAALQIAPQEPAAVLLTARIRRALGLVLSQLDQFEDAITELATARALLRAHGNAWERSPLANDLGAALLATGQLGQARQAFAEALDLATTIEHLPARAVAWNNLGVIHAYRGEMQAALSAYRQALTLRQQLRDLPAAASLRHNLGVHYAHLGFYAEGISEVLAAQSAFRQLGDLDGEAMALASASWIHLQAGAADQALHSLDLAQELQRRQSDPLAALRLLEQRAAILLKLQRFAEAAAALDTCLRHPGQSALDRAYLQAERGAVELARGQPQAALADLRPALSTFQELGLLPGAIAAATDLARAEWQLGNLRAASAHLEAALAQVESLRSQLAAPTLRSAFLASRMALRDLAIDFFLSQGQPARAFAISEQARARSLLDLLGSAVPALNSPWQEQLQEQQAQIRWLENRRLELLARGDSTRAAQLATRLEQLLLEHDTGRGEALAASRSPLRTSTPLSLKTLQTTVLDPQSLLLVYSLGERQSVLWRITANQVMTFTLPPRHKIADLAHRAHERLKALLPGQEALVTHTLDQLSTVVLAPVAKELAAHRLLIVSDLALQLVPFGALPQPAGARHPGEPLLVDHEIVYLPSASVLGELQRRQANRTPPPELLAMIADPVYQIEDPRLEGVTRGTDPPPALTWPGQLDRLRFADDEAAQIVALARKLPGGAMPLVATGFDATRELVLSGRLRQYRVLHFATHGFLNSRLPALSGLALAQLDRSGQVQDGMLWLQDLLSLELPADLVVLSACQSGLGRELSGEGQVGLPFGFFAAGASRLVASLWEVDDSTTARLMTAFYHGLWIDQLPPGEALRQAQLSLRQVEPRRAWAGFVLLGDFRPLTTSPKLR